MFIFIYWYKKYNCDVKESYSPIAILIGPPLNSIYKKERVKLMKLIKILLRE